ncbi:MULTISPECIES: MMPL family transporter [unclassified Microbacterium]|uniref:MMPL family transporter n=1 Tax=unclassified Microbacterium TaxID=2609290 RepID=UPI00214BEC8D|nr:MULTISPECIES: MMPL family transporter [unclassified Microbacterium]MCR2810830.1 MMPL family transporter [Microbacterium sp. zg.B185]WIM19764.1 MMPL family transporter [Microbacterium sp. zg-B185]
MSTLLYALGRWSYRHPWRVLVGWILLLAIAGAGALTLGQGTSNTFSIPGTESQAGIEQLNRTFPQASGTSAQMIVVAADEAQIGDEPYATAITDTVAGLEDLDGILAVTDPFDEMVNGLVSEDGDAAIVRLQFDGQATDVPAETKTALQDVATELREELPAGSEVALGGDLFAISVPGVTITEAVGLLIALLVLIVTFRSFVVAGLPLLTAIIGVGLSLALLFLSTAFASITSTTPLLALMLGLAVGIDYALFIVARHQDQVRDGMEPEESVARATGTAGSAVVFAGITVLIALIGLSFAGIPFLTTMGIAAAVAVAIAVLVALTLTPAMLAFLKGRVAGRAKRPRTKAAKTPRRGFAERWVGLVTKHPIVTTVAVVLTLGVMAIPAASLALALPNAGMLPQQNEARQSYDMVAEEFGPGFNGPIVLTGTIVTSTDPVGLMNDLGDDVASLPGVEAVALATPNETADTGIVQLIPTTAPDDPATAELVRELRDQHDRWLDEFGIDVTVTGFTAVAIDISDQLGAALIPFGVFVVGLSLVLLTIVFRSIAVPIKAALGYLLSVAAAFGVVAAVFEWGWLADVLHVTRTGPIISFMPIVLMGVLFGLAMDYEVFLVSRMREDYVHARRAGATRAEARAVAVGAVRSGFTSSARVVTAAALIMFAVFVAFVPEGDASLKPIALGLAAGIVIDAFLVRMTLTPAVMALLGDRAWWLPKWLERVLPHFDIEGEAVQRELELADWPEPDSTAAVVAADVSVSAGDLHLIDGAGLRVERGEALVVTAKDARGPRALLLALSGRAGLEGRARVGGHLLPGREAWVRAHVGVALLDGSAQPVRDLRRALAGAPRIVVIDGVDALTPAGVRDQAAAVLRDAASVAPEMALIVASASPEAARGLLADAGWPDAPVLDVTVTRRTHSVHPTESTSTRPTAVPTTEVHA